MEIVSIVFRSKTCPQCRERTTLGNIKKIYFNFSNSGTDTTSVEGQVQSMTLEIYENTETIKSLRECTKEMQEKITFANKRVKHMEGEIYQKNSIITALKNQTEYYRNLYEVAEQKNRRIPLLEGEIRELKEYDPFLNLIFLLELIKAQMYFCILRSIFAKEYKVFPI